MSSPSAASPIRFALKTLPFVLDSDETPAKNAPETMAGGVAVFDYNGDGRPDIFLVNGADIATLKKSAPKYDNRLYRNDGNGVFTDVTAQAGLKGKGYDIGIAVADYDNDGHPDIFVAGVHGNTLYHNNGDGTFNDVTAKAGLDHAVDPEFGPLWSVGAAWVDVNNDGLLDLFVVNYMQWSYVDHPLCSFEGRGDYCHPRYYKPQANQLFLNQGDGTFKDVSAEWGIRQHPGKGMSVAIGDYDQDGRPDLFVPNDALYNSLFHNLGNKFEEVAFESNVALPEDGQFISGMGADFNDYNNDGYDDIFFDALNNQTFPLFRNTGKSDFQEVTTPTGLRTLTYPMAGYGLGMVDFDNDGWKDLFLARGHVSSIQVPGTSISQRNAVLRNPGPISGADTGAATGPAGKWTALIEEAGLDAAPAARHRGCAFGDLDGDGRVDVVVTALAGHAEIWMNRSPRSSASGHWLDIALRGTKSNRDGIGARIKIVTATGMQWNHRTSSIGYASSSYGPVHFGLGADSRVSSIEIHWPSGIVQTLSSVPADRILNVVEPEK